MKEVTASLELVPQPCVSPPVQPMKEVTASLGLVPQPCVSPPVQPVSHAFPTPFPRDPLSTDLHTIPLRLSWLFL